MLPSNNRLRSKKDVLATIRSKNKIHTPYIMIYIRHQPQQNNTRAACIVGKKVHKSAVKRHAIQRKMREITHYSIKQAPHGYDMVWVAQPSIINVKTLNELKESVVPKLLSKLS